MASDYDCLILCTSLPSFVDFNNKNQWIRINNVNDFINELTKSLIKAGVEISEVLFGSCIYNDKELFIKKTTTKRIICDRCHI